VELENPKEWLGLPTGEALHSMSQGSSPGFLDTGQEHPDQPIETRAALTWAPSCSQLPIDHSHVQESLEIKALLLNLLFYKGLSRYLWEDG
jgi:hypothetical protein